MKISSIMMMTALSVGPLMAASLQDEANALNVPATLEAGATQLPLPQVADAEVSILGADYEQIISADGKVAPVVADTPVRVSFQLKRGDEKAVSKDYTVLVKAAAPAGKVNAKPQLIPEILQWQGGAEGSVCDMSQYMEIFLTVPAGSGLDHLAAELAAATGKKVSPAESGSVRLNLVQKPELGDEGYELRIGQGVEIEANTPQGLYWGSRTLLQMLRKGPKLPCGTAVDIPRYKVRGFILDVGRLPIPFDYLKKVVDTMAWYKLNDFHIHLNDNYIFLEDYKKADRDPFKEPYTGFRMESDIKGPDGAPLTSPDVSYTKKQFRELIDYAKARGVNIVPEFDAPAHALSFTRVRPDLRLVTNNPRSCEELDAAKPESAAFINEVWDEYLLKNEKLGRPVFDGCVVHIGADEFKGDSEDYRKFTDAVLAHIQERGYTPRLWGSLSTKKGKTPVRAKGVQINLWNRGWYQPQEALDAGFDIINSMDGQLYIVPFADYYRMDKNHKWVYNKFVPHNVGGVDVPAGHPQLIGSAFAVWNDMIDLKYQGYGSYDLWDTISGTINVVSQKFWGVEDSPRTYEEHRKLAGEIGGAPGVNAKYLWEDMQGTLELPAATCAQPGAVKLDLPSRGPNYHLTMKVNLAQATPGKEQVLLSGPTGQLLACMQDGTVGFRRDDSMEFSFGYTLPAGKDVTLELIGKPESTTLLVDGKPAGTLSIKNIGTQVPAEKLVSTFVLPLQQLKPSFQGSVKGFKLDYSAPAKDPKPAEEKKK